jgi:type IV pilus assembly protein PilY1
LIKRIDTGVGDCNGLSTPVLIDTNFDEKVDYVYAGALQGNLWKFDLTSSDFNNWEVAFFESGTTPQPLFQARDPSGEPQPITTKPDVMFHCEYPEKNGYMVVFGTGKYLGEADISDTQVQTVYGVWDFSDDEDDTEYLGAFRSGTSPQALSNMTLSGTTVTLLQQTEVFGQFVDVDGNGLDDDDPFIRVISNNPADWTTTSLDAASDCSPAGLEEDDCDPNGVGTEADPVLNVGWYFDLPQARERIISDLQIRIGNAVYISFTPDDSPCGSGGTSIVHETNACTGGALDEPQFDINKDGVIDEHDRINIAAPGDPPVYLVPSGLGFKGRLQPPAILRLIPGEGGKMEVKYFSSSAGSIETMTEVSAKIGMIYWQELF